MSINKKYRTLVLGLGSKVLSDGAVGPLLIDALRRNLAPCEYDFNTSAVGGLELIDYLQGYDVAFIIDSTLKTDTPPGSIAIYEHHEVPDGCNLSCVHDLSFREMIRFAKEAGVAIPANIKVIMVRIEDDKTISEEVSPAIQKKFNDIVREIKTFIQRSMDEFFVEQEIKSM
jgi:hydrogenase maturation protease